MVEKLVGLVLVSSRGYLILDPFPGIFSTCVPAVMMDREAVGVEIEQEYLG
jgi:DNA modification methylase